MLGQLFSFSGRIGRRSFILWAMAGVAVSAGILVLLAFAGIDIITPALNGSSPAQTWQSLLTIAPLLADGVFLPGLAVIVKRLRDIGLSPWLWVVAFSLLQAVSAVYVSGFVATISDQPPPIGLIFDAIGFLVLAGMPGARSPERGDNAGDDEDAQVDWVQRAAEAERRLVAERRQPARGPDLAASAKSGPSTPAASAVPVFGRRR